MAFSSEDSTARPSQDSLYFDADEKEFWSSPTPNADEILSGAQTPARASADLVAADSEKGLEETTRKLSHCVRRCRVTCRA